MAVDTVLRMRALRRDGYRCTHVERDGSLCARPTTFVYVQPRATTLLADVWTRCTAHSGSN